MWRVKAKQNRASLASSPSGRIIERRQTVATTASAITSGEIEKIEVPLIAPPNLPKLDAMLDQHEKRESSPDAPMVMLLPTQAQLGVLSFRRWFHRCIRS